MVKAKKQPGRSNRCSECGERRCFCRSRRTHTYSGDLTDRAVDHGYCVADRLATGFWLMDMSGDDSISDSMSE